VREQARPEHAPDLRGPAWRADIFLLRAAAAAPQEVSMSLRLRLGSPLLALALAAGLAAPSAAEDPPPAPSQPTPEERAEKVLAGLAAPAATSAWSFEGEVYLNGKQAGVINLRLAAMKEGEADLWQAVESVDIREGETPILKVELEAFMDARLIALHGKTSSKSNEGTLTLSWRRTPMGYGLEKQEGEKEPERGMVRDMTALRASISGLVRFLQAVPAEPATYGVRVLVQDVNVPLTAEARVREALLEVRGVEKVTFGGTVREVWVVRRKDGDSERFLWFDPKDRAFLAMVQPSSRFDIVKKGLGVPGEAIEWNGPARSARMAAMQVARAFAVADVDALEKVIWWPAITAKMRADTENKDVADADLKARVLTSLKSSLQSHAPAPFVEEMLKGMADDIKFEDAGEGRVRAEFPEMFRSLKVVVMQVEGLWYMAEFPRKP
jgi:hypothetical protein